MYQYSLKTAFGVLTLIAVLLAVLAANRLLGVFSFITVGFVLLSFFATPGKPRSPAPTDIDKTDVPHWPCQVATRPDRVVLGMDRDLFLRALAFALGGIVFGAAGSGFLTAGSFGPFLTHLGYFVVSGPLTLVLVAFDNLLKSGYLLIVAGTGVTYGFYAWLLVLRQHPLTLLYIVAYHFLCGTIAAYVFFQTVVHW